MAKYLFRFFVVSLIVFELFLIVHTLFFYKAISPKKQIISFLNVNTAWADSTLKRMSLKEKVAQLFVLKLNAPHIETKDELQTVVRKYNPGGIMFLATEVKTQILLTNSCKAMAKTPILIASEGSTLNLDDFNFPAGMILNACTDSSFVEHYLINFAKVLAEQSVNIDFSSSLNKFDEANDGTSYFSDNGMQNLRRAKEINRIFRKQRVISCLNNFSEFDLTALQKDSTFYVELKESLKEFSAIKIELNSAQNTLPDTINKYLKKSFQYTGLIFSNLNKDVSDKALLRLMYSGIDMFIVRDNIEDYVYRISSLVSKGLLTEKEINKKVRRILLAKTWFGINKPVFQSAERKLQKIFSTEKKQFSWEIYENSATLLKNYKQTLPFRNFSNKKIVLYTIGRDKLPILKNTLNYYFDFKNISDGDGNLNISKRTYTHFVLAISNTDKSLFSDTVFINKLKDIKKGKKLIVLNFVSPLINEKLYFADAIVQLYDNHSFSQSLAAQIISGAVKPKGKIPVQLSGFDSLQANFRIINRLQYTIPEQAGFDSYYLKKVDSIIKQSEYIGASPGYQILAVKNGKVFFCKAYGYHTYLRKQKVKTGDLFDLASITKVAATTLASMKLFEWDSLRMDDSLKYYIDDTMNCTIKNHQLRDFYLHKTGLPPDMPVLRYITYKDSVNDAPDKYFTHEKDSVHTIEVAENFYLRQDWKDSIVQSLYRMEYDSTKAYKYSDINLNIVYDVIRHKMKQPLNKFVNHYFYRPLNLRTMGYLPLSRFSKKRILPTQNDKYWRKQLLQGYAHDESAALYGGVAGNAGLFSDANDLAILFQMLLNGGTYAGKRLLKPETVEYFTTAPEDSQRGLGFNRKRGGLYGHSGYTGCVVWANPSTNFIFVFLSNSIHPKATNKKLKQYHVREKVYDAILAAQIRSSASAILKYD
jgi:CubicO group peptidase (beta-lactamase class C family)/beta-glucosidase-like glycosyl hydrolase